MLGGFQFLFSLALIGVDADSSSVLRTFKLDLAIDQRIDGVVVADANTCSWVELGAALSNDDVTWLDDFAAVLLDAKALCIGISTVFG